MKEGQANKRAPLSVFISYAHEDEPWRQRLEAHLSLLRRQGWIADWHDRQILAGEEWAQKIDEHLEAASIILLLISPDFLASDYCYDIEMQRAMERHKGGLARVIPIILRPCDWKTSPFARLQSLPRDGKAVTTWQNQDEAFLAIAQGLRRVIEQQRISTHLLPEVELKNRRALIKQVRTTWIEGLLEHSLHEAARLELHLQERPDALANPWRLQVQELDRPPRSLPAGTSIVQIYDEADGKLLILGEPGAGKTTLLLELARTLLDRAEADEHHRIPVIFHLSSWAEKCPPLSEWLVEELWIKYQIPRKIAQSWMASDQLLPLLDGLDEVAEEARSGCVQTINAYFQQYADQGPTPLVVCCRNQEYMGLQTRILLHQAVSTQPLTDDQIERYLQSAKGQLEVLQHALQDDPELYELARRPLMLSIFTLAYQGAGPEELPTEETREAQQRQVFATYVERMIGRRRVSKCVSREHLLRWLTFVAVRMGQHHQTMLYLEGLQPDWLTGQGERTLYRLSLGLVYGLVYGLGIGLGIELIFRLVLGPGMGWPYGLVIGLLGLGLGARRSQAQIRPSEVVTWSLRRYDWRVMRRNIIRRNIILRLGGLLVGTLVCGLGSWLLLGPGTGLAFWLVGGLGGVLLTGFSINSLDEHLRLAPNRGIWRSALNGLVFGLGGLLVGTLVIVSAEQFIGFPYGLVIGLAFGLVFGLLGFGLGAGLFFGLGAFLQHFTLRFWLWRAGSLPWNLVTLLDEAAERLLLRKVGGGYIFIHRLLLDYFASLEKKEP